MSYSLNTHRPTYTTTFNIAVPAISWSDEFVVTTDEPGDTKVGSLSSGRAYPHSYEFKSSQVDNVYNGTHLQNSPQRAVNKTGTKVWIQKHETWSKTNSEDASFEVLFPEKMTLAFTVPNDELVTASVVMSALKDFLGGLFEDETGTTARLNKLLLGSTNPI